MTRLGFVLAWLLTVCGSAHAHGITFTLIELRLEPEDTQIRVEIPIQALLHEQPLPLPIGTTDQTFRADRLPAGLQTSLTNLLKARLSLDAGGKSLPVAVGSIEPAGEYVVLTASAPPVVDALGVRANLFPDDALHRVFVDVYHAGSLAGQYVLGREEASFVLAAPERPLLEVIGTFVREGVHHIFIGPDHILFVLALILLGGTLWSQVKIITAFTAAHSITLALATLGIVRLPARPVESVIALSIVVVGLHDLRQLRRGTSERVAQDPRVPLAFTFGLVHGLGFASALAEFDLSGKALAWALAGFNVGVEMAQVTIVLLATPLLVALHRHIAPRIARDLLSATACVVVLVGGFWLCQRLLGA